MTIFQGECIQSSHAGRIPTHSISVSEYLTERTVFGAGSKEIWEKDQKKRTTPELIFDSYTKTQMACKISKSYKVKEIKIDLNNYEHRTYSLVKKKKEIQKNAKNLFGSSKIDLPEVKKKKGGRTQEYKEIKRR